MDGGTAQVHIGGVAVMADVAKSFWQKTKGLMLRPGLGDGEGMLFVFGRPKKLDFWMMLMRFPIDIAFLDAGGRAVAVHHSAKPTLNPFGRIYPSGKSAKYALEIRAGFCRKHGVKKGALALITFR